MLVDCDVFVEAQKICLDKALKFLEVMLLDEISLQASAETNIVGSANEMQYEKIELSEDRKRTQTVYIL